MQTKNKVLQTVFTVTTACFVLFIFSNSLFSGQASGAKSGAVLAFVQRLFSQMGLQIPVTEYFIRKMGHFAEYFAFGGLLLLTVAMYTAKPLRHFFMELFLLCFIPVTDEFIQYFVEGRGSSVTDVMLDFAAGLCGLFLVFLIYSCVQRRRFPTNGIRRRSRI